jgi:flagellar motor switch protein FliN/FliY
MSENKPNNPPQAQEANKSAPGTPRAASAASPAPASASPTASATATAEPKPLQPGALSKTDGQPGKPLDLEFLLDIPLQVRVEVGRTRLLIQELLQLGKGSVVELNKLLGEPFEVLVNEKLVARGEVVVVNDRFGVRLTDIISPHERVQSLG